MSDDICWCMVAMSPLGGAHAVIVIDPKDKRPTAGFKRRYKDCEIRVVTREQSADMIVEYLQAREAVQKRLDSEYGARATA